MFEENKWYKLVDKEGFEEDSDNNDYIVDVIGNTPFKVNCVDGDMDVLSIELKGVVYNAKSFCDGLIIIFTDEEYRFFEEVKGPHDINNIEKCILAKTSISGTVLEGPMDINESKIIVKEFLLKNPGGNVEVYGLVSSASMDVVYN